MSKACYSYFKQQNDTKLNPFRYETECEKLQFPPMQTNDLCARSTFGLQLIVSSRYFGVGPKKLKFYEDEKDYYYSKCCCSKKAGFREFVYG